MSFELLYTSAPAGLKPGTRGFTTVQCTDGIPSNVALRLETLSGYRHLFPPSDPRASENPVCYSHLRVPIAGRPTSVVSRIADYGADYSGRTNKIAYHVVLEPSELTEAGPGWLIRQKNFLRDAWDGTTRLLPVGPVIPSGSSALRVCESWNAITGDAGWGGYLADAIEGSSGKPVWIVFRIDQSSDLPLLIEEALTLLPPQQRWQATFSTYYTNLPPEVECRIRCVVAGSEEAKLAPTRGVVIDISLPLPILASTPRVEAARTGVAVANIPPVQSSVQSSATGRGPRHPLVEANEDESLWTDDEIRLAPPTVPKSQGGPPAIKNAKDSGPPNVKLPPDIVGQQLVLGRFSTRSVRVASILLILSTSILIVLGFFTYPTLFKITENLSVSESSATSANRVRSGNSTANPNRSELDSGSGTGLIGKKNERELILPQPVIGFAKEDILRTVSDSGIVFGELFSTGSKLLKQSHQELISLAIAYSAHRKKALLDLELEKKASNVMDLRVADENVAQDKQPIQASTKIFKSVRDRSLNVEFELPNSFTKEPTSYKFQLVTEKDQVAGDIGISIEKEYDTKQGIKLTLTFKNNKIRGVANIDKDFLKSNVNAELNAIYLLGSDLISMHASYADYKQHWNSLLQKYRGSTDLLANATPLPAIDLQSLHDSPEKSLNQLERCLSEIAAFRLMMEQQPNARKMQADYKVLVDALPKKLNWNIADVRDRCNKLNDIEMIPEFTIGVLQFYRVSEGELNPKTNLPIHEVTLRLNTVVK